MWIGFISAVRHYACSMSGFAQKRAEQIASAMPASQNNPLWRKCATWFCVPANPLPSRSAKMGPMSAVTPKVRKLIPPVALPFTSSGLTSLMIVYGIMAAPEAMPKIKQPIAADGAVT